MKNFTEHLSETLTKSASVKNWIDDFQDSDAPQFKGKSKKKKIQMALAAYYSKMRESHEDVQRSTVPPAGYVPPEFRSWQRVVRKGQTKWRKYLKHPKK